MKRDAQFRQLSCQSIFESASISSPDHRNNMESSSFSTHHRIRRSSLVIAYCTLIFAVTLLVRSASSFSFPSESTSMTTRAAYMHAGNVRIPNQSQGRRDVVHFFSWAFLVSSPLLSAEAYSGPMIDVNNAVAREYTAFPGLYPTIAAKLINAAKKKPFTNKAQVYAALDNDIQRQRLQQYDAAIFISSPDMSVRQFKESQICKYECKGRVSARQ